MLVLCMVLIFTFIFMTFGKRLLDRWYLCGAAGPWVVCANTLLVTSWFLSWPFSILFLQSRGALTNGPILMINIMWHLSIQGRALVSGVDTAPDLGVKFSKPNFEDTNGNLKTTLEPKDVLPNIHHMQADERAAKCRFLSLVTLAFDLQTRPREGPRTSSVWIWCKSVQRFRRYFITNKNSTEWGCQRL